jgi:hypothetical protein
MTSTWIVKNKKLEHINAEGEGRGMGNPQIN